MYFAVQTTHLMQIVERLVLSPDACRGLDSDEIMISKVLEKDQAPSRRKTNVGSLVQDHGSREHGGPQGAHPASVERTDLNGEQTVDIQEAEHVPGKPVLRWSEDQVTSSIQRKATPGRVHGLNGMPTPGRSRELMERDSLEDNGRPAPVGTRGGTDYDGKTTFSVIWNQRDFFQQWSSDQLRNEQLVFIFHRNQGVYQLWNSSNR